MSNAPAPAGPVLVFDTESDDLLIDASCIHCVCVEDLNSDRKWAFDNQPASLKQAYELLLTAARIVGHNVVMHDIPLLERLVGRRFGLPPLPKAIDTLLISRLMYPDKVKNPIGGHSLEDWGYFLKCRKTQHTDFSKFSPEMLAYCGNDTTVGKRIYLYQRPRMVAFKNAIRLEHEVAEIIGKQIQNGVEVNDARLASLQTEIASRRLTSLTKLQSIFPAKTLEMKTPEYYFVTADPNIRFPTKKAARLAHYASNELSDGPNRRKILPFNPNSNTQVAEALMSKGWSPKTKTATGAPQVDKKVLEGLTHIPEAAMLLEYSVLDKRRSQAEEWFKKRRVTARGVRIHGGVTTNGCVTGRMSHSKPNMNVPKVGKPLGRECRACFGPRLAWKQVGCDAKGLEARMLANRMWKYDNGAYAKIVLTGDIHTTNMAALGFSTDPNDPNFKANRDTTKTWYYAYSYGAGDGKLGSIIEPKSSLSRQKKVGAESRARFMRGMPAMAKLTAAIKAEAQKGYLTGLDGRRLPVRSDHASLNTQLQSDGAIVMKVALVLTNASITQKHGPHGGKWAFMLNVHDEFQIECIPGIADDIGKIAAAAIEKAGVVLGIKVPLGGDYKVGNDWAECH